jgi:uncharacterized protein YjbJ (UPF0337 family)
VFYLLRIPARPPLYSGGRQGRQVCCEHESTHQKRRCADDFCSRREHFNADDVSNKTHKTHHGGYTQMGWNRVEGNWKQVKGKVKEKWGRLTDDDLDVINGRRDQLEGKIQERYGLAKDQVRKDIDDWYTAQRW